MSAPGIILNNISLAFAQQTLFNNLSCEFTGGQFTCLLGPSGVGKSSLLHLIADLYTHKSIQYSGTIRATDNQPIQTRIAYMAQTDSLLPWLNTEQNCLLGSRLRGEITSVKKIQARELLKRVGLKNPKQKIAELSGGMRQRVALVRTLLEDKPIVLMDEPFAALDVITRLNLHDLAAELLQHKTVILVTHDPLEALRLGHVIYVLAGMPAQLGAPIIPAGTIPRAITAPTILQLQGELLARLQLAQELM
ncbi:MAG: ABC transporter ATP-binding protein [Gammaproteobacteria bacterium]|nr:ABC transporter ATP-binding protein [Gammaproteobacteria bacterium]